jgi:hypothetical protein
MSASEQNPLGLPASFDLANARILFFKNKKKHYFNFLVIDYEYTTLTMAARDHPPFIPGLTLEAFTKGSRHSAGPPDLKKSTVVSDDGSVVDFEWVARLSSIENIYML